jgi:hypothetical protein
MKPRDAVLLRHDLRVGAGLQERPHPKGVVGMAMRVDRGMKRGVAPLAHRVMHGVGGVRESRIDQQQTDGRSQRIGIHKRAVHQHIRCHFLRFAEPRRPGMRRVVGHHRCAHR